MWNTSLQVKQFLCYYQKPFKSQEILFIMETKTLKRLAFLPAILTLIVLMSGCIYETHGGQAGQAANMEQGLGGLLVYPGSHPSAQYIALAGMAGFSSQFSSLHSYVVEDASPDDVISWYKSRLSDYATSDEGNISVQGYSMHQLQTPLDHLHILYCCQFARNCPR